MCETVEIEKYIKYTDGQLSVGYRKGFKELVRPEKC